jgi:serine/threonine-protein kinase RsbW
VTAVAPFHRKFDSDPAQVQPVRLAVEELAQQIGFAERCVGEIGLVTNEAIANVIEHAYNGEAGHPIEIWAEAKNGGIEIRLRDWGPGIDPSKIPVKEKDPLIPGGLGLICMREMMNSHVYSPPPADLPAASTEPGAVGPGILLTLFRHLHFKDPH